MQLLNKYFNDFYERHQQLIEYETGFKDHDYFLNDGFNLAETHYVDAVAELSADIQRLRAAVAPAPMAQAQPQTGTNSDRIRVPRVPLPIFAGDPKEWESFKHRFTSLVGSKTEYTSVDKLQFLLSALQGNAATRLRNLELINENYKVVWDLLEKRYGNKRRTLATHLDTLIELKPIRSRNAQDLSDLLDKVAVTVRALEKLDCNIEAYNHWLVHCIFRVLDPHTKETWKISQESKEDFYLYTNLITFLENRMESLDSAKEKREPRTAGSGFSSSSGKFKPQKSLPTAVHIAGVSNVESNCNKKFQPCPLCQTDHSLSSCEQFNAKDAKQRYDFCKKSRLCINCLRKAHTASECKSSFRCSICKQKHHSKLHFDVQTPIPISPGQVEDVSNAISPSENSPENFTCANLATVTRIVLLPTATILVSDSFGNTIKARALIDPGAQRSFITERLVKQLSVERRPASVDIFVVGGKTTSRALGEATISLRSLVNGSFQCTYAALILPELTCLLSPRDFVAKEGRTYSGCS